MKVETWSTYKDEGFGWRVRVGSKDNIEFEASGFQPTLELAKEKSREVARAFKAVQDSPTLPEKLTSQRKLRNLIG